MQLGPFSSPLSAHELFQRRGARAHIGAPLGLFESSPGASGSLLGISRAPGGPPKAGHIEPILGRLEYSLAVSSLWPSWGNLETFWAVLKLFFTVASPSERFPWGTMGRSGAKWGPSCAVSAAHDARLGRLGVILGAP